jgi:hypothetical protein
MEPLSIKPTNATPSILLDKAAGIFEIKGNSLPEDVATFYDPVLDWIRKYCLDPNPLTTLTFKLTYLNTASSKIIFTYISILEPLVDKGKNVRVNWYYIENDEDTFDLGKEYSELLKIPFVFTSVDSF